MADRAPPMHDYVQTGASAGAAGDPPDLANQTWVLLNTFAGDGRTSPMDTFVSFADSDAPPNQKPAELWMRVPYTDPKDGMPLKFVEVESARGPAGRVYMLQNVFGGSSKGWVTYEEDSEGAQWFHASACAPPQHLPVCSLSLYCCYRRLLHLHLGCVLTRWQSIDAIGCMSCCVCHHSVDGIATEAALVRVEQTGKAGQYTLVNMGKANHPVPPTSGSYISFCSDGLWVRCNGYQRDKAMTVQLLKPGAPAPPAPPPTPVRT